MNTVAKVAFGSTCVATGIYGIRRPTDHPLYKTNFHKMVHHLNIQSESKYPKYTKVSIYKDSVGIMDGEELVFGPICVTCGHVHIINAYPNDSESVKSYGSKSVMKEWGSWVTYDEFQKAGDYKLIVNDETVSDKE